MIAAVRWVVTWNTTTPAETECLYTRFRLVLRHAEPRLGAVNSIARTAQRARPDRCRSLERTNRRPLAMTPERRGDSRGCLLLLIAIGKQAAPRERKHRHLFDVPLGTRERRPQSPMLT